VVRNYVKQAYPKTGGVSR